MTFIITRSTMGRFTLREVSRLAAHGYAPWILARLQRALTEEINKCNYP